MFVGIRGEDKDIFQIHHCELIEDVSEDVVHEALVSGGSIGDAILHDQEFEMAILGLESGFLFVTRTNAEIIVGSSEVDFGEDPRATETIEDIRDERKWITVFHGYSVEAAPIDT